MILKPSRIESLLLVNVVLSILISINLIVTDKSCKCAEASVAVTQTPSDAKVAKAKAQLADAARAATAALESLTAEEQAELAKNK